MKTIFDCETEIGACEPDWERNRSSSGNGNGDDPWKVYIHTKAEMTRAKGMLKVEQRCFVRSGDDVADHPEVKSDMILEPALGTEEESLAMVEQFHQKFIARARQQIGNGCLG